MSKEREQKESHRSQESVKGAVRERESKSHRLNRREQEGAAGPIRHN